MARNSLSDLWNVRSAWVRARDAVEGFVFRKQRVDAFGVGELGFKAVGPLDVPGGKEELGENGELDGGVGAEFVLIGCGEGVEFLVIFVGFMELAEEWALPSGVLGPEESWALV